MPDGILKKYVDDFRNVHPDKKTQSGSDYYFEYALGPASNYITERCGGPDMYWHLMAEVAMKEFEPNSQNRLCKAFLSMLNTTTAMASEWQVSAAPSMQKTYETFRSWYKRSRLSINRFLDAQDPVYPKVLHELQQGQKSSHWMWFIFPQMKGIGSSEKAVFFGLLDRREIDEYLQHPILFSRLVECTYALLEFRRIPLDEILPYPDNLKLISSMTAFAICQNYEPVFDKAIQTFSDGNYCTRTIGILAEPP